ncbi:MAG: hypothetical protein Q4D38_00200 [Planctomycetia bacterium]|nr:hypothetical protein [Planctomycetia bacterium]
MIEIRHTWDCPECCGEVCSSPCSECENPFGATTQVNGNFEVVVRGLPQLYKPTVSKTQTNYNLTVYESGCTAWSADVYPIGEIRKERNSDGGMENLATTNQDYIYNEDFLLPSDTSRKTCYTNDYGNEVCVLLGLHFYRVGSSDAGSSTLDVNLKNILANNNHSLQQNVYIYTYHLENISVDNPMYYTQTNAISSFPSRVSLRHYIKTTPNCDSTRYNIRKGICYSDLLEGITLPVPISYTVSGVLYVGDVSSFYTSDREGVIQRWLSLLSGRGYECVQSETSFTDWNVYYAENLTVNVDLKFIPSEA